MLSAAKHLAADRDIPFAELTLSEANVLRVTRCACSTCQGPFVHIEPCLNKIIQASVGADLSRTPPSAELAERVSILRPSLDVPPGKDNTGTSIVHRKGAQSSKFIVLLCCLLVICSGCASLFSGVGSSDQAAPVIIRTPSRANTPTAPATDSDIARSIVQGMTLDQKLGQMVIVEFYGATLNADLIQMIQGNRIGGVLIENKNGNAQSRNQLVTLNKNMQGQAHIPLFISTDFEGGLVNELRQITGERPSEAAIGATGNPQVAYNAGHEAATTLTSLGLNVNFMPIVDVLTNPNNPGLPMRAFGSDPTLVTNMGRAYLKGLTDGGVIGCLKHFPGLGSASVDPHFSLPYMNRSLAAMSAVDLMPYRTLINEGIVPMVMVTHILNPQLDPKLPTSLSPNVVTKLLRQQLNFNGVIISDTLWMGGISNTYSLPQAAVLAVRAGTDLLLGPRGLADTQNMIFGLHQAVMNGQISVDQVNASVQRILELKLHYKILTRDKAMQLIDNGEAIRGERVCGCVHGLSDIELRHGSNELDSS